MQIKNKELQPVRNSNQKNVDKEKKLKISNGLHRITSTENNAKKLFAWDFHGVLEKGNEYAVQEVCNSVLAEFEIERRISLEETLKWYGLRWIDYFRNLSLGLPEETLEKMVRFAAFDVSQRVTEKHIQAMDYASEVLDVIKKAGHHNIIISNSHPERLLDFVKIVKLEDFFDKVIGIDRHSKEDNFDQVLKKAEVIDNYYQEKGFRKIIVIGDTEDDIEAGKKLNATTYLFSRNEIKDSKADFIISDLRKLLKEV